jgi:hypothetical protein
MVSKPRMHDIAMRDIDLRKALRREVRNRFDSDSRVVEEMVISSGISRIDMAVVNGSLYGFEIKSDVDTLKRLPKQAQAYSAVFDYVNLVVGSRYTERALSATPSWWGIYTAEWKSKRSVDLKIIRQAERNTAVDPALLIRLLWRKEVEQILLKAGHPKGVRKLPFYELDALVINNVALMDLQQEVRTALKNRQGWLSDPLHK